MRKITLMLFMCLISWCSYAQYPEGFEGTWTTQTGSGAGGPAGWAIVNEAGPIQTWIQGNGGGTQPAHQGTKSAFMNNENVAEASLTSDWLITPATVVPTNGQLRFWSHLLVPGPQGTIYRVRVSTVTTAGTVAEQTTVSNFTNIIGDWTDTTIQTSQLDWEEKILSLNAWAGQTVYIAFQMQGDAGDRWAIDDVNVVSQCLDPTGLGATAITATTANLTWTNPSGATQFEVEIMPQASSPTGTGTVVSATTSYTATGLTASTCYKYYVKAICGVGNTSGWVGPFSFCTTIAPQVPTTMPVSENWENGGPNGWSLSNGTQTNKWVYGTATSNSPTHSIYISNDSGATNSYTNSSISVVHAYRDIIIPAGADQASLQFDWKAQGESATWDYIQVWLVPVTYTPVPGTRLINANSGGTQIGGNYNLQNTWQTRTDVVNIGNFAGQTRRLIFEWWNDGSGGTNPPGAIDNINFSLITCPQPTALTIGTVTQNQATFSWTAPNTAPASYDYYFSTTNTPPTASTTPTGTTTATTVTIPNLTPSTAYYFWVGSHCSDSDTSLWTGPANVTTTQIPAVMPVSENWENGGTNGWTLSNGTQTNKWVYGTATANSPTHSIYVSNNNGTTNAYTNSATSVVHAYRDIAIPAGADQAMLQFDWKAQGESATWDYVQVWLVPVSYTPVPGTRMINANSGGTQIGGNYNLQNTWQTRTDVVNIGNFAGQTRRLIFEWWNDGSGGTNPPGAIDNINFSLITCPQPTALTIGTVTENQATFSWTAPNTAPASYDYYFSTTNTAPTASTTPTGNTTATTVTIPNLTPSTQYYFWVRSHCSDSDTSFWTGPANATTTQIPAVMPVSENWESGDTNGWTLSNGTQTNKWVYGTATSNSPTHSIYVSNNNGTTNAYTNSATSVVHAYRDIAIPAGAEQVMLQFDWKAQGESATWDYVQVWLVPTSYTPVPGTRMINANSGGTKIGLNYNLQNTWQTRNDIINVSAFAGQTRRLIFEWWNDGSGGTNPPGAIDNINLSVIPCPQPSALTVTDETTTTMSLSWTGTGYAGVTYQVYYTNAGGAAPGANPTTNVETTTNTSIVLEDLEPSTVYDVYLRALCDTDDGNSFWIGPVQHETDPLCPEPVDLDVTCLSSTGATISWTADGSETSWEIVVQPASAAIPTSGTIVTEPIYLAEPLTPNTAYTAYVRAICPDVDGFSSWAEVDFTTNVGPGNATAICTSGISVPSSTGAPGYGQIGCLGSTPNPIWYYFTVQSPAGGGPGNMNFTLTQVNNNGVPIDVDFAAFGPFESALDACSQIDLTPGANNPLIVACSYSASATEIFSITGAEEGEVYALLITNFNGSAGNISLTQTNASAPGAPTTSCDPVVELGNNQTHCATDSIELTANVDNPGVGTEFEYVWTLDGGAYTPTIVETGDDFQTIVVEEEGEHVIGVTITVTDNVDEPTAEDLVVITLSPAFTAPTPAPVTLCGTTGTADLDLSAIDFLGNLDADDYEVDGVFVSNANAQSNTNAINTAVPYNTGSTILYIRISDSEVPGCFQIGQLVVTVNTTPSATITYADSPFCSNETTGAVTQTGQAGGVYTSTTGLVVDATSGTIDVTASEPGTYVVTYTIAAANSCPEVTTTAQVTVVAAPEATIAYEDSPYCSDGSTATVTFTGTVGGTYTSTAGLVIDATTGEIDLDASTVGTYVVTYTIADTGDCVGTSVTTNITITELPTAAISYAGSPYCSDAGVATVTFTGNAGGAAGTYTGTDGLVINAATGEIDLAANAAGTYTVTYTVAAAAGCGVVTATADVTITELPEAGFSYAYASVCQNAATQQITLADGATAGTFSADVTGLSLNPATGAITPGDSQEGTYVVTNTIAGANGCGDVTATFTIVITPAPVPTFSYAAVAYCQDETTNPVPVLDGASGTFSAPAGLVINAATGEVNLAASTPGTYVVTNTIAGSDSCPTVVATAEITITSLPVLGTAQGCEDNLFMISVNFDNDAVYSEDTVTIEWTAPDGSYLADTAAVNITGQAAGTYSVEVTPNDGAVCPAVAQVVVERTTCFTPKGVSPNDDGKNDTWDLTGFNVRKVSIFNRYGKEVYNFSGVYTDQFAGIASNGEKLPSGTYFYMFERIDGTTETGWVYVNFEEN